jgi:hypothetical protein
MKQHKVALSAALLLFLLCYCVSSAQAALVQEDQARTVVETWILSNRKPLNSSIGNIIQEIVRFYGGQYGTPGYYVAFLNPRGWIVVPADDTLEPVAAFGDGVITPEEWKKSPLAALMCVDTSLSTSSFSVFSGQSRKKRETPPAARWKLLLQTRTDRMVRTASEAPDVLSTDVLENDILVAPLLGENQWRQDDLTLFRDGRYISMDETGTPLVEPPFFNYYTFIEDRSYPAGCGPLATAQVMDYFEYPNIPASSDFAPEFTVHDQNILPTLRRDRGVIMDSSDIKILSGDVTQLIGGSKNGAYDWQLITPSYDYYANVDYLTHNTSQDRAEAFLTKKAVLLSDADKRRNEIAALLHDIGMRAGARYTTFPYEPPAFGTGTLLKHITAAMRYVFHYPNVHAWTMDRRSAAQQMMSQEKRSVIFPNLDDKRPLIWQMHHFDTFGADFNHIAVIDGYADQEYPDQGGRARYVHVHWGFGVRYHSLWLNSDKLNGLNKIPLEDPFDLRSADITVYSEEEDAIFVYNIMSDDQGKELVSGRLIDINNTPGLTSTLEVSFELENGTLLTTTTDEKGVFVLRVPSNSRVVHATLEGNRTNAGDLGNIILVLAEYNRNWDQIGVSNTKGFTVGNKYYGNIYLDDIALIMGSTQGIEKSISSQFNRPLSWNSPKNAAEQWDFSGLSAVYRV